MRNIIVVCVTVVPHNFFLGVAHAVTRTPVMVSRGVNIFTCLLLILSPLLPTHIIGL